MRTNKTDIRLVYDRCVHIKPVYDRCVHIKLIYDWYTTDAYTQIKTDIYIPMVYDHACMQYLNKTGSGIWSMNMGPFKKTF